MNFLYSMLVSFLPPRLRRALGHRSEEHLAAAAGVSGFLEMTIFGLFYIKGFLESEGLKLGQYRMQNDIYLKGETCTLSGNLHESIQGFLNLFDGSLCVCVSG